MSLPHREWEAICVMKRVTLEMKRAAGETHVIIPIENYSNMFSAIEKMSAYIKQLKEKIDE